MAVRATQRFRFHFNPLLRPILTLLGASPRRCWVQIEPEEIYVRMGVAFEAHIPRQALQRITPVEDWRYALTAGAHTDLAGNWVVNASSTGLVRLDVAPAVRGRVLGIPVRVRSVMVSVEDRPRFLALLG